MMQRNLLVSIVVLASLAVPARSQAVRWQSVYNGPASENDFGSKALFIGRELLVAGSYNIRNVTTAPGVRVARHRFDGSLAWERLLPATGTVIVVDFAVAPDGNLVVLANPLNGNYNTVWLLKLNAVTGALMWSFTYFDEPGTNNAPEALAIAANGDVYVAGYVAADALVLKVAGATGARVWTTRYRDPNGPAQAYDIALDSHGTVYAVGAQYLPATRNNFLFARFDPATGAVLSASFVDGGAGLDDRAQAVAVSAADEFFVAGFTTQSAGKQALWLVKLNAGGSGLWERKLATSFTGLASAADVKWEPSTSTVAMAGTVPGASGLADLGVGAYDAVTGAVRFTDVYDGPGHGTEMVLGLTVDRPRFALLPFGKRSLCVAGATDRGAPHHRDILLRRYDLKTGVPLATFFHDGPLSGDDRATVAVSAQGFVGLTGEIDASVGTHTNWVTLLLDR